MNKEEFLKTLEDSLLSFPEGEKKEILYDYEEHFRIGFEKGKTEEELINELGEPQDIANQYRSTYEKIVVSEPSSNDYKNEDINYKESKPYKENSSISVAAAVCLILFNLIFIVGPYLGFAAALIGLFVSAVAVIAGGLALTFSPMLIEILNAYWISASTLPTSVSFLFGVGTIALGLLFFIGVSYISKYFFKITHTYIKWNLKVIRRSA